MSHLNLRSLIKINPNDCECKIFKKLLFKISKCVRNPESLKLSFKKDFKKFDFFKDNGMSFLNFMEYVCNFDHFDKDNVYCVHINCGIKPGGKPYFNYYAKLFAVYNKHIKKFRFLNMSDFNDSIEKKSAFIKELYYTNLLDKSIVEFLFDADFMFVDVFNTALYKKSFGNKNINNMVVKNGSFLTTYNSLHNYDWNFQKYSDGNKMTAHSIYICKINPKIFDTNVETYRNMILINSLKEV